MIRFMTTSLIKTCRKSSIIKKRKIIYNSSLNISLIRIHSYLRFERRSSTYRRSRIRWRRVCWTCQCCRIRRVRRRVRPFRGPLRRYRLWVRRRSAPRWRRKLSGWTRSVWRPSLNRSFSAETRSSSNSSRTDSRWDPCSHSPKSSCTFNTPMSTLLSPNFKISW